MQENNIPATCSEEQSEDLSLIKDSIKNALIVGMSYNDACILAGCTLKQIDLLDKDELFQLSCKQAQRELEQDLLNNLRDVITIQASKGKDHAVTWLLSKINKRYSDGEEDNKPAGNIIINTTHVDVSDPENAVEVN